MTSFTHLGDTVTSLVLVLPCVGGRLTSIIMTSPAHLSRDANNLYYIIYLLYLFITPHVTTTRSLQYIHTHLKTHEENLIKKFLKKLKS